MKYIARFVFYYYDEFDTTCANIYDILIEAAFPYQAFKIGKAIVECEAKKYYWPGQIEFISLREKNRKKIYVLSNNRLVELPKKEWNRLPTKFCHNRETFFFIVKDRVPKMCFFIRKDEFI